MPADSSKNLCGVVFVGYSYLSTPIYEALKDQLDGVDLHYVLTKDIIGSDVNSKFFDASRYESENPLFHQLKYNPPWYTPDKAWHLRGWLYKLGSWVRWFIAYKKFKRELRKLLVDINPQFFIATSDLFFSPRFAFSEFPKKPMYVVQPCYLDLWERKFRYPNLKRAMNRVQSGVFETQQYFGMEILNAKLLVWESSAINKYRQKGRDVTPVVNPLHLALKNKAENFKNMLKDELIESYFIDQCKPLISIFPAIYSEIHGEKYQENLEKELKKLVREFKGGWNIIIKIHPNEDEGYWRRCLEEFSEASICFTQTLDKFKIMAASRYHISTNSYSSVEATLIGTLAINFVPGVSIIGREFCTPFNANCAEHFYDSKSLINFVQENSVINLQKISVVQNDILGYSKGHKEVSEIIFHDLRIQ